MVTSSLKKKKKTTLRKQCFSLVPLYLSPHGEDTLNMNRKERGWERQLPASLHPTLLEELLFGLPAVRGSNWTGTASGSDHCTS